MLYVFTLIAATAIFPRLTTFKFFGILHAETYIYVQISEKESGGYGIG